MQHDLHATNVGWYNVGLPVNINLLPAFSRTRTRSKRRSPSRFRIA